MQELVTIYENYQKQSIDYLKRLNYITEKENGELQYIMDNNPYFCGDSHVLRVNYLIAKGFTHFSKMPPERLIKAVKHDDPYGGWTQPWLDLTPWKNAGFIHYDEIK